MAAASNSGSQGPERTRHQRLIGGDGDDEGVVGMQQRLSERVAMNLDLRVSMLT